MMPTYCRYRVKMDQGTPSFEKCDMPLFLESSVRDMRLCESKQKRKELFEAVHRSELFDGKLGMYRVNQALDISELELGRAAAFTPGWLEMVPSGCTWNINICWNCCAADCMNSFRKQCGRLRFRS